MPRVQRPALILQDNIGSGFLYQLSLCAYALSTRRNGSKPQSCFSLHLLAMWSISSVQRNFHRLRRFLILSVLWPSESLETFIHGCVMVSLRPLFYPRSLCKFGLGLAASG